MLANQPWINGVRQLKEEQNDIAPTGTPMTSEQLEIRALEKKNQRIEEEKEILTNATTTLLMSDSLNGSVPPPWLDT